MLTLRGGVRDLFDSYTVASFLSIRLVYCHGGVFLAFAALFGAVVDFGRRYDTRRDGLFLSVYI